MHTLTEYLEDLKYNSPTIKRIFVELLLAELVNENYPEISDKDNINKLNFISEFISIYLDIKNQKFESILNIEILLHKYYEKSLGFKTIIESIFVKTFEKLGKTKIPWDNELDVEPIDRFIKIQDIIPFNFPLNIDSLKRERYSGLSDKRFSELKQEFTSLILEKNNPNIISVGILNSYANIDLPKVYDIIFDTRDLSKFIEQKTIVKWAINYRDIFHTDLWRGHHSHCLIEIIGEIPEIFNELPQNDGGMTSHKGIGLCTKYDWQFIKERDAYNSIFK